MLSLNQVLNQGRYRITDQFGNVDSGRLYEAYDTVSNTKVVLRESSGTAGRVATAAQIENSNTAFVESAKRLTDVQHPSLMRVTDYFSEVDRQYLVMESCDGNDLTTVVANSTKPLSLADIARWGDQMLDGLHFLHNQNPAIIHKRVNPKTARISRDFKVKLLIGSETREADTIDAGIADDESDLGYKSLEQLWLGLDSASRKMIANGLGTRSEEILRKPLDASADVYSVGATLYYLLTGTEPVDSIARYLEILDGNPDPLQRPEELNPAVPAELSNLIVKSLELKREDRFSTAGEMRAALAAIKIAGKAESAAPAIDQRSLDIEAERRRLEEEQAKIRERQLALEAEAKRQAELAETKQLEEERAKAEAERKASEERALLEERVRNESLVEDAKKAISAEQPLTKVDLLQMDLAKDDLLDLPAAPVEISVEPNTETPDVLRLEPVATEEQATAVSPSAEDVSAPANVSFDLYGEDVPQRSFITRPPVLGGLAAIVVAGVVGVWMFAGSGSGSPASSSPSPAAAIQSASKDDEQAPVQAPAQQPVQDQSAATTAPADQLATSAPASAGNPKAPEQEKAKQKPAAAQQAPQPAKPAAEKPKKVTVDDLINDN